MKRSLCLFAFFVLFAAGLNAQQKFSLSVKNEPLEKVFARIEKQTSYTFFYDVEIFKNAKKVTVNVKDATLTEELAACLKDEGLDFKIVNNTISIVKKKEPTPALPNTDNIVPEIRGRVTDSLGNPLAGATVLVKGSGIGTSTDNKGNFMLSGVNENAVLLISFTGYSNKQIRVTGNNTLNISLNKSVSPLDEIQVIAYGTTSKRLNTGDVSSVKAEVIEQQPVSNPLLALEGRVPGMQITQSNGLPGTAVRVQIRGQNSIFNGNEPLYIIDGVPYTSTNYLTSINYVLGTSNSTAASGQIIAGSPLSYINPADIESMDILKDADATAIYGTRGANGVVLITTKKGKAGQTKIDINLQNGWGKVADKMKLLNTPEYLEMRNEAFKNDGTTPNPNADFDLTLWDTTRQTDWQKELLGGTAQFTQLEATASGGNANTQFLIGAGYNKQTTVFPGDFNDIKSSVHFSINNVSPNQRFRIQLSGMYIVDDNHLSAFDLTSQALTLSPDAPAMYNPDGTINWENDAAGVSTWPVYNPAAMLLTKYNNNTDNLVSNAVVSYHIIDGLDIKSSFGYTNTQTNETQTTPLVFFPPSQRPFSQREATYTDNSASSWIIEPQLTYNKNISQGILSVLLGTTFEQNTGNSEVLDATGFNSDLLLNDIKSATSITVLSTVHDIYKYNSVFARLNYNWKEKYLINLTARQDGSSRFGPANQFHNFGAIGAAWIFSKEQFAQKNLSFLSFGKLRGSFGTTGSDQVGDYTFMDLYAPITVGVPYQNTIGFGPTRIFTPDLGWEETKKLEGGLELGFLQDRILFNTAFYQNRSSNQLIGYTLPTIAGFTSVEKNLPAVVQNQGWEFLLTTVNIKLKNFQWTSSINLTINRNKLLSGTTGLEPVYQEKVGHSLSSVFVYNFLGVDPFTGLYQVANGEGKPTSTPNTQDANVLINTDPKYYGGFENSFTYKGFQFDILFQFKNQPYARNYLYTNIPGSFTGSFGGNEPVDILNRWQQPGDVKPFQRFSQNASTFPTWNNAQQSSQVYSNASYIRLKNIALSWQLPQPWQRNLHLQNARLYIHAQNILTITNYQGLDPETTGSTGLPPLKVLTVGIQMTL